MKSIHRAEYSVFCQLLRDTRRAAGLSQVTLAQQLGRPQNYVSAFERGKLRQDFLQLRDWCHACGTDVVALATAFEERWAAHQQASAQPDGKQPLKKRRPAD